MIGLGSDIKKEGKLKMNNREQGQHKTTEAKGRKMKARVTQPE